MRNASVVTLIRNPRSGFWKKIIQLHTYINIKKILIVLNICVLHFFSGYGRPVLRIRIRIRIRRIYMFLGLPDEHLDLLVRYMDPDPDPDTDASIINQKL